MIELGAAHVVTQSTRYGRFTYLAFFTQAEEQSMALLGSVQDPSPFNTARHIELTALIGNDLTLAQKIAETINRHRPAVQTKALTVEQASRQLNAVRTRSKRYWLWLLLVAIAAAALEFLWD